MRRLPLLVAAALASSGLLTIGAPAAHAAGELWKANSVINAGCDGMDLAVTFSGQSGEGYVSHTRAYVGGKLYMNEDAGQSGDGDGDWGIYFSDSYDSTPVESWPMPPSQPVTIYLDLEKPKGTVLSSWKLVLDGCETGKVLYNNLASLDVDDDLLAAPQDKCPQANGAGQADGCPVVKRRVTLKYKVGGGPRLVGVVRSPAYQFSQRVAVTLFKKVPGKDIRLGKVKTGLTNHYSLRGARKPGKYYAVVAPRRAPAVGKVERTVSPVLKVR